MVRSGLTAEGEAEVYSCDNFIILGSSKNYAQRHDQDINGQSGFPPFHIPGSCILEPSNHSASFQKKPQFMERKIPVFYSVVLLVD